MERYIVVMMLIHLGVDMLLLLCADRACGSKTKFYRVLIAAVIGAAHAGACMIPGFAFLGNWYWHLVFLCLMGLAAYGMDLAAFWRILLFMLLSAALGIVAIGSGALSAAGVMALVCFFGFPGKSGKYSQITVSCRGRSAHMTALKDTGNLLTDPVTGEGVIVAGASVARQLLGLTQDQLSDPIGTLSSGGMVGLRLIPYRAVGQSSGMLLAVRPDRLIIDKQESKCLIAFAPNEIGSRGGYEALTGG